MLILIGRRDCLVEIKTKTTCPYLLLDLSPTTTLLTLYMSYLDFNASSRYLSSLCQLLSIFPSESMLHLEV